MPDGTIIHELQGKLVKIEEVKTIPGKPDAEGKPTTFRAQAYFLEAPSNSGGFPLRLTTTRKEHFVGQELTGVLVRFITTAGSDGMPRGLVKSSYPYKDDQGVARTSHKVVVGDGAFMSRVAIQPPTQKPQAPSQKPAADPVLTICREWRYCWDKFRMVAPPEITPEISAERVTAIWIECNKRNIKIPIAAPSPSVPEQPETSPPQGKPESTPAEAAAPATPRLTKEQLGTKIIGDMKITQAMLAGHDLEKVFDLCYADAKNEIPVEFLDAAFDAAKKRHKDETKLYTALLTNWSKYLDDAKKRRQAKADEDAVEEMDITPPFE